MREIREIIIHCSATPENKSFTAKDIDTWHKQRGYNGIGYHYVIRLDGSIENGRGLEQIGAHAYGHNAFSIGICYIGGCDEKMNPKDTRTPEQVVSIIKLLQVLMQKYPKAKIIGHNEISDKACPSFDVQTWLSTIQL